MWRMLIIFGAGVVAAAAALAAIVLGDPAL